VKLAPEQPARLYNMLLLYRLLLRSRPAKAAFFFLFRSFMFSHDHSLLVSSRRTNRSIIRRMYIAIPTERPAILPRSLPSLASTLQSPIVKPLPTLLTVTRQPATFPILPYKRFVASSFRLLSTSTLSLLFSETSSSPRPQSCMTSRPPLRTHSSQVRFSQSELPSACSYPSHRDSLADPIATDFDSLFSSSNNPTDYSSPTDLTMARPPSMDISRADFEQGGYFPQGQQQQQQQQQASPARQQQQPPQRYSYVEPVGEEDEGEEDHYTQPPPRKQHGPVGARRGSTWKSNDVRFVFRLVFSLNL
jgi:hypothetical protein